MKKKMTKELLRKLVREQLNVVIAKVNLALRGKNLKALHATLERVGRGGKVPHWFDQLEAHGTLPNLDGKTIGSIVEMLLIGVLETDTFKGAGAPTLRINPARGIDLPDLDLGVKSPSENYCTSEPYFSAYERLYGSEHDALVLLTDYQNAKKKPPLKLQIIKWDYLEKSQLADVNLCRIARKHRAALLKDGEARTQRLFRFLAYVNQSDWLGRILVSLIDNMNDPALVLKQIEAAEYDFTKKNIVREKKFRELIPEASLVALRAIPKTTPLLVALTDAADNWVTECMKEVGRLPNDNEWNRLKTGPLDGRIGMSFALQWRYNFGRLFGVTATEEIE
jgi:hypothetical protein